jgi:hypothetical protein
MQTSKQAREHKLAVIHICLSPCDDIFCQMHVYTVVMKVSSNNLFLILELLHDYAIWVVRIFTARYKLRIPRYKQT